MNIQDRLAELFLPAFDWLTDRITFGGWSRWQGDKVPGLKIREH